MLGKAFGSEQLAEIAASEHIAGGMLRLCARSCVPDTDETREFAPISPESWARHDLHAIRLFSLFAPGRYR